VNRGLSLHLDALRALAAIAVVVSHFAYPRFSGGDFLWVRDLNIGSDAVMLFFVLSGFVIAYAAAEKDRTAGTFLFNRLTRIYSVALPAVVLTFVLDRCGVALDPAAYDGWWYEGSYPLARALTALTFTNEIGFTHIRIGSNGPYWSLAYEVWYYVIFAAVMFLSGARRWIAAAALALVAGPKILVLGFAWVAGVVAYRLLPRAAALPSSGARWLFWAPPGIYAMALAGGVPDLLLQWTTDVLGPAFVTRLGFSDEFIWNAALGLLGAAHVLGAVRLSADWPSPGARVTSAIRWLARGSFSLYVVHYPLMQFLSAAFPGAHVSGVKQAALLLSVFAGCYVFAALFERTLPRQRQWLRQMGERWQPRPATTA
jgi:peptidoglycan/LPS O-acetylase OafA/YrhL